MLLRITFSALLAAGVLFGADDTGAECKKDFTTVDYIKYNGQCIEINEEMSKAIAEIINQHKNDTNILYEQYKKSEGKSATTSEGQADGAKGAELFKKCIACHGAKAEKKALNKSAIIAGMEEKSLVESMQGYKAGTLNTSGMGALMKAQMAPLSEEDMKNLAAFISQIK